MIISLKYIFLWSLLGALALSCSKMDPHEKEEARQNQVYCLSKEEISKKAAVFLIKNSEGKVLSIDEIEHALLIDKGGFQEKLKGSFKGSCLVFNRKTEGDLTLMSKKGRHFLNQDLKLKAKKRSWF